MTALPGRRVVCPRCYGTPPLKRGESGTVLAPHVRMDSLQPCPWSGQLVHEAVDAVEARETVRVRETPRRRRAAS